MGKKTRKKKLPQPPPAGFRKLLREAHGVLMETGVDYHNIPGKVRLRQLLTAHAIAEMLRQIGNGVDDPMPPKFVPEE